MDVECTVRVDASFARPGVAFGATSYASGFLSAHKKAVDAGTSRVVLRPFLPATGFQEVEEGYRGKCRRSHLPGYLGRLETSIVSRAVGRDELVHWMGNHIPPVARRQPSVITLNDLMTRHYLANGYPATRLMLAAYHRSLWSLKRVEGVVVYHDETGQAVRGIDPEARVVVAAPGPGRMVALHKSVPVPGLDKRFLLLLGASAPHKRLEGFRESFLRGPLPQEGWMLVHAGSGTAWRDGCTLSLTGVSDEQICWLLQNCRALAMPSSYEGWGMPVTEAAIFGVPIVVSDGVPSRSHASTIAPVYVLKSLGDPQTWDFLLDQGDGERRDLSARKRLADYMWQEHVRLVDGLYTSLNAPNSRRHRKA